MPDAITALLAVPGLVWLICGAFIAGLVRGFAGFGTAMIYLPVAGQFLTPFEALTTLICMDLIGPLPNLPRAVRDGHYKDVLRLGVGVILALPLGVYLLSIVAPEVFRYGVSIVAITLLVLLISGLRYSGAFSNKMVLAAGGLGGFLAGSVGLPGPPVIMLHMASKYRAKTIRGNMIMYLMMADWLMLGVLHFFGHLELTAISLGVFLAVPYLVANMLGAAIFQPKRERVYRAVAYAIIAMSAISGLPFFD